VLQAPPEEPVLIQEKPGESITNVALYPADQFILLCLRNMGSISKPLPGWSLTTIRCRDTFVEGSWNKTVGSADMIQPYLTDLPQGAQPKFTDASTLLIQRAMPSTAKEHVARDLIDKNHVMLLLSERFNALGSLQTKEVTPVAAQQLLQGIETLQQTSQDNLMQNAPNIKPITSEDLPYVSFVLTADTPPNIIIKYFDIPGTVIEEISGSIPDGHWHYEGKIIPAPDKNLVEANAKARALLKVAQ